ADKFAGYRTLAAFPILKDRDVLGAVSLYSAELGEYHKEHQKLIEEATAFLATALSAATDEAAAPVRFNAATGALAPQPAHDYKTAPLNLTRAQLESELTH
ncbi:MAG: GAF domain-containing protein, partial [Acidobacteria bacterium]|nr:GAF domain-containing protein [Acidobacteriota bacterium]